MGRRKVGRGTHQNYGPTEWGSSFGGRGKQMKSEAGREIWGRKGWRQREQTSRKISARKRRRCHWPECPTQEWARQWATGEREWE